MASKLTLVTNKALEETGAPYELKEAGLGGATTGGPKPQWFTDVYRSAIGADVVSDGKVPVLIDADLKAPLAESAVIAEYVAAKFASTSNILPTTPVERALSALFLDQVSGKVVMSFYGALKATEADAETQAKTKEAWLSAVAGMSTFLAAHGGPYVTGTRFLMPDLLVWPFVERFCTLKHYRGLEVPDEPAYAAYHTWVAACKARPCVAATAMPEQFFAEGYSTYAHPPKAAA